MTDITTQQAYIRPVSRIERQANALDELRQLHHDFELLQNQAEEQRRTIINLNDRNALLISQLQLAQQNERIVTRKLMRLAQSVVHIGMLTKDADAIMKSGQDYEDDQLEQHHQVTDGEIEDNT